MKCKSTTRKIYMFRMLALICRYVTRTCTYFNAHDIDTTIDAYKTHKRECTYLSETGKNWPKIEAFSAYKNCLPFLSQLLSRFSDTILLYNEFLLVYRQLLLYKL